MEQKVYRCGLLERLDLSFIVSVTPDHVGRILNVTCLNELIICNPSLSLKEVVQVAAGRIVKVHSSIINMRSLAGSFLVTPR